MSNKTLALTDDLHAYLVANGSVPDPVTADLIEETWRTLPDRAGMQIAPEQARFLTLFTKITGARHAVEVGTFTGLSALSIARGLPDGGRLVCCDISAEFTAVAQRYWERAGLTPKIDLRIGPALQTLQAMPAQPQFDLAFLDADKTGYIDYWAELVPRMTPGGVLLVDNVLRNGRIIDPETADDHSMVAFNQMVLADDRVESVMLPIADGLTLARVKVG